MVEGARLESVCRGNSTEGSNPSLSANPSLRSVLAKREVLLVHRVTHACGARDDLARIPNTRPHLAPDRVAERDGF